MYLYLVLLVLPLCSTELVDNRYYPEEIDMPIYCPAPVLKRKPAMQWPWTLNEAYWYVCNDGLPAGFAWGLHHCCEVAPLKNGQCTGNCVHRDKRSLSNNQIESVSSNGVPSLKVPDLPQAGGPQKMTQNKPLGFDNNKLETMLEDIHKKRMLHKNLNSPSLEGNGVDKEIEKSI